MNKINEDKDLIEASMKGDEIAFEKLFTKHIGTVRKHLISLSGSEYNANDIIQETYIKAYTKINTYKPHASFGGWLCLIAKNIFIDQVRKDSSKRSITFTEYNTETNEIIDESTNWDFKEEKISKLEKNFNSLPKEYREVLNMRFFLDMNYEEISQTMNVPIGTIKTWIHRAKQALKKQYK